MVKNRKNRTLYTYRPACFSLFSRAAILLLGFGSCLSVSVPSYAKGKDTTSGTQLFATGKFNQAHDAIAASVKRDPKNIALRIDLIRTSLRLDNWQNAITEAQSAITSAPQNADAHGLMGMALFRAGRPLKAEKEANKSLALNPKDYWGLIAKGRVQLFNELKGAAHETFTKAVELHPEWPDALHYLMNSFDEQTPQEEQQKAYIAYVKLHPKGYPHDLALDGVPWDVAAHTPSTAKKSSPVFEATGKIDAKRLKAADEGKEKPVTITFPFERNKDDNVSVIIPLSINGVRLHLLFDTGAGHGINIAGPAAERLNLRTLYKSYARGVSGKEETLVARADEMKIGTQVFKNIPVHTMRNSISPDFDGLIGGAVFEDYAVTIDYETDNMILTRGKTASAPKPQEGNHITTVAFHNIEGYIFVPLKLEDREEAEWGLLDTGCQPVGVLAYSTAHDLAKKRLDDEKLTIHVDKRIGVGTSNTGFDAILFEFPIDLGLVNNGGTPYFMQMDPIYGATMIDTQVNHNFDFHLSVIVGIPYLAEAKRVTFDYPHHLLTMEFGPKNGSSN